MSTDLQMSKRLGSTHVSHIEEKHYRQPICTPKLNTLKSLDQQVTFVNSGGAAATLRFDGVEVDDTASSATGSLEAQPAETVIRPKCDVIVKLRYQPRDFRPFKEVAHLISNTSAEPISIPYCVQFQRAILQTMPRCVIDIGVIQFGKDRSEKVSDREESGEADLRTWFNGPQWKHPIVEQIDIETHSANPLVSAVMGNGFIISPDKSRSFNVKIPYGTQQSTLLTKTLVLGGYTMTTPCDPIVNVEGIVADRQWTLLIIGHIEPEIPLDKPNESHCQSCSSLRLFSPSWLRSVYRDCHNLSLDTHL